ncbi:hypothetical protein BKA57DRAFT_478765 [Linnemannia elongata]|nr:hypothetical protein BKA57DRAFT_478765 [Linnemannia elongata]
MGSVIAHDQSQGIKAYCDCIFFFFLSGPCLFFSFADSGPHLLFSTLCSCLSASLPLLLYFLFLSFSLLLSPFPLFAFVYIHFSFFILVPFISLRHSFPLTSSLSISLFYIKKPHERWSRDHQEQATEVRCHARTHPPSRRKVKGHRPHCFLMTPIILWLNPFSYCQPRGK